MPCLDTVNPVFNHPGDIFISNTFGGGGAYFVVMQPRIKNKSKLPAREQTIRISPLINEWSGGGGGEGVINFLPLKRGFIIEGV